MPRLKHLNCQFLKNPILPHRWMILLTTPEDHEAVDDLGLSNWVEKPLTNKGEAERVLNRINDRANQLRNPSFPPVAG